jgi:hypothetical protein
MMCYKAGEFARVIVGSHSRCGQFPPGVRSSEPAILGSCNPCYLELGSSEEWRVDLPQPLGGVLFVVVGAVILMRGRINIEGTGSELTGMVARLVGILFIAVGLWFMLSG